MTEWSFKIGRFLGIDVFMHVTFILLISWVAFVHRRQGQSAGAAAAGVVQLCGNQTGDPVVAIPADALMGFCTRFFPEILPHQSKIARLAGKSPVVAVDERQLKRFIEEQASPNGP